MNSKRPTSRKGTDASVCRVRRFVGLVGLGVLTSILRADPPENELAGFVNAFESAGNYTWEEKRLIDIDSRGGMPRARMPVFARGQTVIGAFTVAEVQKRQVVVRDGKVAFLLPGGDWRHMDDMKEADLDALGFGLAGARNREGILRRFTLVLPHELLDRVFKVGRNIRKVGVTYEGDLPLSFSEALELEIYLMGRSLPTSLGRSTAKERPGDRLRLPQMRLSFVVWIENDVINELTVTIQRETKLALDGGEPEVHLSTTDYDFKITEVGRTRFDVPAEAQAVLNVR